MAVTRCFAKISASDFRKTPKDLSTLFVRFNHSESLAELASPEVKGTIVIRNHFKETELKRALALEDHYGLYLKKPNQADVGSQQKLECQFNTAAIETLIF
eukprot:3233095-Amphidinium_carterae.1